MKTAIIIGSSILVLLIIARWAYCAFRRSLCCGTCGCNLLTDKQKKSMLAKREKCRLKQCLREEKKAKKQ